MLFRSTRFSSYFSLKPGEAHAPLCLSVSRVPRLTPNVGEERQESRQGRQPGQSWRPNRPDRTGGILFHPYLGEQAEAADAADDAVHPGEARTMAVGLGRDRQAPSVSQPLQGLCPTGVGGAQGWGLGWGNPTPGTGSWEGQSSHRNQENQNWPSLWRPSPPAPGRPPAPPRELALLRGFLGKKVSGLSPERHDTAQ